MTIHLKPDLEAILKTQVDLGRYPSIEAALDAAVRALEDANATAEDVPANEDLSWAKPLLEEAERDFKAGRVVSPGQVRASIARLLKDKR